MPEILFFTVACNGSIITHTLKKDAKQDKKMRTLKENEYLVYHYSSAEFKFFNKDKADGFWFTDIEPSDIEMLNEIGANGAEFVARCIIEIQEEAGEIDNYDVFEQLEATNADGAICIYDGFSDYVVADNSQIEIIEWVKL